MSIRSWWKGRQERRRVQRAATTVANRSPLREFVYLDVMSLESLLVSQNMTIPESVSQAVTRADEAELTSRVSADALVGKGEVAARYQASTGNSQESSRKAVIQSLFKEFRELPLEFKLSGLEVAPDPLTDPQSIEFLDNPLVGMPTSNLVRGDLIEVEVELSVDPVFRLALMMTEWSAMADEYPQMFDSANGGLEFLAEAEPVVKLLERFLAGLIPIRATAVNYVVVDLNGEEYILDARAVQNLDLPKRPLQVVGVTEQQSYWRDIRRVLFSRDASFRILGRVARDGIQSKWTPVKLADLFSEVAPDLVDQVNAIEAPSSSNVPAVAAQGGQQVALGKALGNYRNALLATDSDDGVGSETDPAFAEIIAQHQTASINASTQRKAFDAVRELVCGSLAESPFTAEEDLVARQQARKIAGLQLFPAASVSLATTATRPSVKSRNDRLIDIEIVAIYW